MLIWVKKVDHYKNINFLLYIKMNEKIMFGNIEIEKRKGVKSAMVLIKNFFKIQYTMKNI